MFKGICITMKKKGVLLLYKVLSAGLTRAVPTVFGCLKDTRPA